MGDTVVMLLLVVLIGTLIVLALIAVFDLRRPRKVAGNVKDTRSIERVTRDARRDAEARRAASRGPNAL